MHVLGQVEPAALDLLGGAGLDEPPPRLGLGVRVGVHVQQVDLTDPAGNRTTYAYDNADRVTTVVDALGSATYAYDAADERVDRTDRTGRRTTYAYDAGGRRTGEKWFDAGATVVRTLAYGYDNVGRLTSAADPDTTLTFAYDAADRLTTLTRSLGGVAGPRVLLGYDPGDRLTSIHRTINGVGTDVATTLAYDAADRLTTLTHGKVVSGVTTSLASYTYAYDAADRLATETLNGATVTYTYDNADQLTAVGGARTEAYAYDSTGNRNSAGYATVAGNMQTASPGVTYTYDGEGNLKAKTELYGAGTTDDIVTNYAYDHRNRLTGVTRKDSAGAVTAQATYTYDPLDRRIGAQGDADGAGVGVPVQRWTAYDGVNAYADFDGSNALTARYLHGPAVDFLLAKTDGAGGTAWYLPDRLGSVRNLADTAGTLTGTVAYDSYGKVLSSAGSGTAERFKFTGREYDAVTGLYDYRARTYDPTTGRFISRDPIGFAGGDANLQRYVGNSPTNATDPSGLMGFAETPLGAGLGAFGNGLYNMGVGVGHTAWDFGAIPYDLLGTTFHTNWTPRSYYGTATEQAMQGGTPWYVISGEGVVNAGSLGTYGLAKAGLDYYETGDPTNFQQTVGPFALGSGLGYAGERGGVFKSPSIPVGEAYNALKAKVAGRSTVPVDSATAVANAAGGEPLTSVGVIRSGSDPLPHQMGITPRTNNGNAPRAKSVPVHGAGANNAADATRLSQHYRQLEKYGQASHEVLENDRFRYYGEIKPPTRPGRMQGARLVREWDPATGNTRNWYETLDHQGRVRSVAPKPPTGPLNHRIFDENGNYQGLR